LWCIVLSFVRTGYRIPGFRWQGICIIVFVLMPPTNPAPCLYFRVLWIRTLGHMGGGNMCGGDTLLRVTMTHWLTGLWSTQAKAEGIVLKAAWHWGSDSSRKQSLWGTRPHPIVCRPFIHMGLHGR